MMKFLLALLTLAAICQGLSPMESVLNKLTSQTPEEIAEHSWVVIVAGSTGWSNYRHQADMCHAYQLVHQAGVPDERIIVFMNDDIANSYSNPFPGQIFNYPVGTSNVNVYEGVPHDYIKTNATAANLVSVLTGRDMTGIGSGKTLKSTEEDNVFLFYDDHGNTGILAMPYGPTFTEANLASVLETMTANKMYKQFIGLFSACYSGSMLYRQNYPGNVYFASAAPTDSSSYACYYDPTLRTYINSCWPWGCLDSIEKRGLDVTFDTIFYDAYVYATNNSVTKPCQYGDLDTKANTFSGFLNGKTPSDKVSATAEALRAQYGNPEPVPQYLVPYMIALKNYEHTHSEADKIELDRQTQIRKKIDALFSVIVGSVTGDKASNSFYMTPLCKLCDSDCGCYTECLAAGKEDYECQRHCCNYANCHTPKSNDNQLECSAALSSAFLDSCAYINNDYLYVASAVFNKLCRYPGIDVDKVIKVIKSVC